MDYLMLPTETFQGFIHILVLMQHIIWNAWPDPFALFLSRTLDVIWYQVVFVPEWLSNIIWDT